METSPTTASPSSTGRWRKCALGHQGHALIHGVLRVTETHRAGHDLAYQRVAGVVALKDSLAGEVPFGKDTDQSVVGEDQQRADVLLASV